MNKQTLISKKCSSCGIERPLTAFLILEAEGEKQYGNICISCRQAQANKDSHAEETSGTTERHTIDTKTKIALEKNKKQQIKETEIRNFEETEQSEKEKNQLLEKKLSHSEEQKKHRHAFLDTRPTSTKTKEKLLQQQKLAETIKSKHEELQQEINELNLNAPLNTPTDRLKHQSNTFKRFLDWAGEGSAIARNLSLLEQRRNADKKTNSSPEPSVEELMKNLNPGSRKK